MILEKNRKTKQMIQEKNPLTEEEESVHFNKLQNLEWQTLILCRIMLIMGEVKILKFDEVKKNCVRPFIE